MVRWGGITMMQPTSFVMPLGWKITSIEYKRYIGNHLYPKECLYINMPVQYTAIFRAINMSDGKDDTFLIISPEPKAHR